MDLGLRGRSAIVTGASKGIGKAIARAFADEGVSVALLARTPSELSATVDEISTQTHARVIGIPTDIRSDDAVRAAVKRAADAFGSIHILVNNAGGPIKRPERQLTWPPADWLQDVDTKTIGLLRVTQALLPHMPTDGTGRIVNVSGIAGSSVLTSALTHGLNNAAINHATSYLAADLASARITVNAVIPGLIATEWREHWAATSAEKRSMSKESFLQHIYDTWGIVAKRWGKVEEVADATLFLASDRAAYINGAKLHVDGGYAINVRN